MDVDVVIAWVDGEDPKHQAKRADYLAPGAHPSIERVAAKARRFSNNDEIRYCLRSIRNHAPWVRKIWLVTDNQHPGCLDVELGKQYGVHIIDHKQIFHGFEGMLPTFNSLAIETMLWRIPTLAERFLYFNDDMFLVNPVTPQDFFTDGGLTILRGKWGDWSQVPRVSFHGDNKILAARMLGFDAARFFSPKHVIYPMRVSVMADLFAAFFPAFMKNAAFRFRSREQFWPISLFNHKIIRDSAAELRRAKDAVHFSIRYCKTATPEQVEEKLELLRQPGIRMTCINYMEMIVDKVPGAFDVINSITGPPAPFEIPR